MPRVLVTQSPDVSLRLTPGKNRYLKLYYLLVNGGTTILKKLLKNRIFPEKLFDVLNKPHVLARLRHLKKRGIISDKEWQLLYPPSGSCQPKSFDITLLTKILKQKIICRLSPPRTGWNNLPNQADLSLEADIVRIHQYRNINSHIGEKMEIGKPEFLDYWRQIKDALLRIVGYYSPSGSPLVEEWEKTIDDLMTSPLVADEDQEGLSFRNYSKQLPTQVFSLRCMIKLASDGAWLGGTTYALNRLKNNPDVLANLVESTFPGISVIRVEFGSIKLQLLARDLLAMEELRKRYESGQLTKDLQKSIITEDLKDLANGEPVEFTIEMDEDEYFLACQYLCDNQETNDDTLCTTANTVRTEEEDNLNVENAGKTVSLEKEEDNLNEESTDKTVSLDPEEEEETTSDQQTTTNTLTFEPALDGKSMRNAKCQHRHFMGTSNFIVLEESSELMDVKEYAEKLKSSIKQQTDFLLSEEEDNTIRTDDIFTNVTIQRGPKHFKEPKERRFGSRELDEIQAGSTKLTNCCHKLVRDWPHNRLFEESQENVKVPDFHPALSVQTSVGMRLDENQASSTPPLPLVHPIQETNVYLPFVEQPDCLYRQGLEIPEPVKSEDQMKRHRFSSLRRALGYTKKLQSSLRQKQQNAFLSKKKYKKHNTLYECDYQTRSKTLPRTQMKGSWQEDILEPVQDWSHRPEPEKLNGDEFKMKRDRPAENDLFTRLLGKGQILCV